MRCPDCNKFTGLEDGDPEVQSLEVDADGQVTASVRIVRTCSECSNELKEASFDLEASVDDAEKHQGEGHELSINEDSVDMTTRSANPGRPARYQKTLYGAELQVTVTCECGKLGIDGKGVTFTLSDEVSASGMDELV